MKVKKGQTERSITFSFEKQREIRLFARISNGIAFGIYGCQAYNKSVRSNKVK